MDCQYFRIIVILYQFYQSTGAADDIIVSVNTLFRTLGLSTFNVLELGDNYFDMNREVTFWCFKPGGQSYQQVFVNDPQIGSKIDFSKPLNFVVHGYYQSFRGGMKNNYQRVGTGTETWVYDMSVNWAKFSDANVCAVDWSRLASYDYSIAAQKHTRMVANCMMGLMDFFIRLGMLIQRVSLAGHSLGAHVAGFFGAGYKGQVNAIFGLDSAGPGFTLPLVANPSDRLDPTDAKFVQCLHTSWLGTEESCGHANYRVNDGLNQPGCSNPICSHSRAAQIFIYSLSPIYKFAGVMCYEPDGLIGAITGVVSMVTSIFSPTKCSPIRLDFYGIYTNRLPGKYQMRTSGQPPYVTQLVL